MQLIAQGAEAKLYKNNLILLKDRIKKSYRISEIDEKLRKSRTRREAKILEKLASLKFPAPKLIETDNKERLFSRRGKTNLEGLPKANLEEKQKLFDKRRKPFDKIDMEFIEGPKVRDILEKKDPIKLSKEIGKKIAILHNNNIIHGDLTTSNMIYNKQVYFIDFGLSIFSKRYEDKAVDLHLFRQALESKHYKIWEKCFNACLKEYKKQAKESKDILKRFEQVETRGRNKNKG